MIIPYEKLNAFSSLFFLTNTYHLYNKPTYRTYYYAFLTLTWSSCFHHAYPQVQLLTYIDKASAYTVIYQGWKHYYKYIKADSKNIYSLTSVVNITSFCAVVWLYGYGSYAGKYSFDQTGYANIYHAGMHALSSIGHHFIIGICS